MWLERVWSENIDISDKACNFRFNHFFTIDTGAEIIKFSKQGGPPWNVKYKMKSYGGVYRGATHTDTHTPTHRRIYIHVGGEKQRIRRLLRSTITSSRQFWSELASVLVYRKLVSVYYPVTTSRESFQRVVHASHRDEQHIIVQLR